MLFFPVSFVCVIIRVYPFSGQVSILLENGNYLRWHRHFYVRKQTIFDIKIIKNMTRLQADKARPDSRLLSLKRRCYGLVAIDRVKLVNLKKNDYYYYSKAVKRRDWRWRHVWWLDRRDYKSHIKKYTCCTWWSDNAAS